MITRRSFMQIAGAAFVAAVLPGADRPKPRLPTKTTVATKKPSDYKSSFMTRVVSDGKGPLYGYRRIITHDHSGRVIAVSDEERYVIA